MSFLPVAPGPLDRDTTFPGVLKMTRVGVGVRIRLLPETYKLTMVFTLGGGGREDLEEMGLQHQKKPRKDQGDQARIESMAFLKRHSPANWSKRVKGGGGGM